MPVRGCDSGLTSQAILIADLHGATWKFLKCTPSSRVSPFSPFVTSAGTLVSATSNTTVQAPLSGLQRDVDDRRAERRHAHALDDLAVARSP